MILVVLDAEIFWDLCRRPEIKFWTRDGAAGPKILDPRRRPLAETSSRKSCTQRAERPRLTQHFKRIRNEGAAPKILSNPRRSRLMDHSRFAAETRRTENLETLAEEDA